jgi:hypothetical protein
MTKAIVIVVALALLALAGLWTWPHFQHWQRSRAAQAELVREPVYAVLREHEPVIFKHIADWYADVGQGKATRAQFINFTNAQLSEVATRRLAHASDAAVLALLKDMIANARQLELRYDDSCFRFLFPQVSGPPDFAASLDAAAQARTFEVIANVIRTSAEAPQPLPEAAAVQDNLAAVVNDTYEEWGADAQMIAHADDPRVDRRKVCIMTLSMYDRILARPPADASALIRVMTQVR